MTGSAAPAAFWTAGDQASISSTPAGSRVRQNVRSRAARTAIPAARAWRNRRLRTRGQTGCLTVVTTAVTGPALPRPGQGVVSAPAVAARNAVALLSIVLPAAGADPGWLCLRALVLLDCPHVPVGVFEEAVA